MDFESRLKEENEYLITVINLLINGQIGSIEKNFKKLIDINRIRKILETKKYAK